MLLPIGMNSTTATSENHTTQGVTNNSVLSTTLLVSLLTVCAAFSGCAMNSEKLALENELRDKEQTIRTLQKEVASKEQLLKDQDRELLALRNANTSSPFDTTDNKVLKASASEMIKASNWGGVRRLRIHRLTTGVIRDKASGGVVLNLVIQPLDEDQELVKIAGALTVTVSSVNSQGAPQPVVTETYSITDSRKLWTRGLVSSGFHIRLPLPDSTVSEPDASNSDAKLLVSVTLDAGTDQKLNTAELIPSAVANGS